MPPAVSPVAPGSARATPWSLVFSHFWLKSLGTCAFTLLFFGAYLYLLKNPAHAVTVMPLTAVDHWVGFAPWALAPYLSLWLYVSLPPTLLQSRAELVEYGLWIGLVCLVGLTIFWAWPTAVPTPDIDWARYPGVAFLKNVDAAGNACPSLHVATAVFSGWWLHRLLPRLGGGRVARALNALWCGAIVLSTLATKQHVALDALAGSLLALAGAWASAHGPLARASRP